MKVLNKILQELDKVTYEEAIESLKNMANHTSELSVRMYMNITESTETSIDLNYYRK